MTIVAVACAVIIENRKVLITRRSERMPLPLLWEFPGGKVEIDESPEACILREIREELNINIGIIKALRSFRYDYDTFTVNIIPFLAMHKSGTIKLTEHTEYKWATIDELKKFDWVPADVEIVEDVMHIFLSGFEIKLKQAK